MTTLSIRELHHLADRTFLDPELHGPVLVALNEARWDQHLAQGGDLLGDPSAPAPAETPVEQLRAARLCRLLLEGFLAGETALPNLLRDCRRVCYHLDLSAPAAAAVLGDIMDKAGDCAEKPQARGGGGWPASIRKYAAEFVRYANDNYDMPVGPTPGAGKVGAFEHVSHALTSWGISASPATVKRWYEAEKRA